MLGIDDVECLLSSLEPLQGEGEEDAILLLPVVEEGADMAGAAEFPPGQPRRSR
jgi:hypothetical protein